MKAQANIAASKALQPIVRVSTVAQILRLSLMGYSLRITQLGIINQVYLTATHTRLEHSIGTYSNSCRLVRSLYYDAYSPFFRQVMTVADLTAA